MRQDDTSDRMIFTIPYLIHYLSTFCTLEPGDVILRARRAAPVRVSIRHVSEGRAIVVEVEVSRVGLLRNTVVDDES